MIYSTYFFPHLHTATVAPMVTIQFDIGSNTVNESDGSVTINLVRMGDLTDNITVSIDIIMIVDPAIAQRMSIVYSTHNK